MSIASKLIRVCFKTRSVIVPHETFAPPLEYQTDFKLNIPGYKTVAVSENVYKFIESRFGDYQPKQGFIYRQRYTTKNKILQLDAYGYGCSTNCSLNPYKKELQEQGLWNRPIAMPADLNQVWEHLKKFKNKGGVRVRLGVKNDPFSWVDTRHRISLEILNMIKTLGLALDIYTTSDLVAHDDYLKALPYPTTVYMISKRTLPSNYKDSYSIETYWRLIAPGCPSFKRQDTAAEKLESEGIFTKFIEVWPK